MLAALLLVAAAPLPAAVSNPGFERGLEGWAVSGDRGFRAGIGSNYPAAGRHWLHMGWAARNRTPDDAGFQVSTIIDARRYRGRRVRISAGTRISDGGRGGGALLFAGAGSEQARAILSFGGDEWRRHGVILAIPRNAATIILGFRIENAGPWIEADDVRLEILR